MKITQLTPELRALLQIIKQGRESTGNMFALCEGLNPTDPTKNKAKPLLAYFAGVFGTIGNVINSIVDAMDEATKQEALAIVYDGEKGNFDHDLEMGQKMMTTFILEALTRGVRSGRVKDLDPESEEAKAVLKQLTNLPEGEGLVEGIIKTLVNQPIEKVPEKSTAERAQDFFNRISDEDFANAELKLGGYVRPVTRKQS